METDFGRSGERGSVALVTGGARRLGAHLVRALADEGYVVAFSYHESRAAAEALVDAVDVEVMAFEADLADPHDCIALVEAVETECGDIDLLVNNAAILREADADSAGIEDFDASIALNLRAPYLLSLECARRMRRRGGGSIVNIASVGGLRPYAKFLSYSVSKAGLVMLTQSLAKAFAPSVTVNAVAPGTLWLEGEDTPALKPPRTAIPLGDYGDPSDVCEAVLYLADAPYVTGQVLAVDGGASLNG